MRAKLTSKQAKFINEEFGFKCLPDIEFDLPDDEADIIFNKCIEIEISESHTDDPMTPRGEIAESLVTMIGGH